MGLAISSWHTLPDRCRKMSTGDGNDDRLKATRDLHKSNADVRHKPLKFQVGDRVMLKVSPWKGVIRYGKRGTLNPRYIGPIEILDRIGPVAYRLKVTQRA